ncbi:HAD-IIA family hydrolase [Nocardia cyriacigeorgica]|uniref:HAD-IIA family hydrolase n=1 Tax=Nocardia cyriacigeorgica TaxID=135487 RepID=A0A6P1D5Y8_9NOCA|nr:HAD-IIA family hydrolase [Nocardia cyriacigeorgica]NEW39741.1 HAD-IIA family hydrolase [Nocardia cyriacigeorgica]NEW45468.1 HAD-IIA family hydrolase [Nocardia cyriacigeorgica]NEW52375.1 HAD-IIA family hydrolase [Nocardia cyriacigeorgica]NEW58570.1 HAD-IIA family hydrolase [Nocardia cyriacigeorgica]
MTRLRDRYGALLLDLDGTLYRGQVVIDGAPQALAGGSQRLVYVTNNASRGPAVVAEHLAELGFQAGTEDVVTSAQAAARLLAEQLAPQAQVLVVGTDDLAAEVTAVGLSPVRRFNGSTPDAVVQGHSPETGWPDLAEAAYALRADAVWVAANTDKTLPNERGLAPGNGAMVAALRAASDREPIVAGKPYAPLLEDALVRAGTRNALVVGDRLDTDIEGAQRVELDSLLVLTGVSTVAELSDLPEQLLPTYVADSLDALNQPPVPAAGGIGDLADRLRDNPGRAVTVRASRSEIR